MNYFFSINVFRKLKLKMEAFIYVFHIFFFLQKISRECQLLAGTAMAMLLNLHPDPHLAAKTFIRMYSGLGKCFYVIIALGLMFLPVSKMSFQ